MSQMFGNVSKYPECSQQSFPLEDIRNRMCRNEKYPTVSSFQAEQPSALHSRQGLD